MFRPLPLRRTAFLASATIASFSLLLVSCASTPTTESGNAGDSLVDRPEPTADTVVLVAHGMACPKCVSNADLQLMKIPGVRNVAIDMKHGFVTVSIDPAHPPTRDDYARAIDAAGLTLVSVHEAPAGTAES